MIKLVIHVTRGRTALPRRGFCLVDPNGDANVVYLYGRPDHCWQFAEETHSKTKQNLEAEGWGVAEVELPDAKPRDPKFRRHAGLLHEAEPFVRRRIESLQKDIAHCIDREPYAAFPALLYCFSTVDCLAALYAGNTGRKRGQQTANAHSYMTAFMKYGKEQVHLLQVIYRHKLVHLAEPKTVRDDAQRLISWRYVHQRDPQHLSINPVRAWVQVTAKWHVLCDHEFFISVGSFADDIARSATTPPDGYLCRLAREATLQDKFEVAFAQMSDPDETRPKKTTA